MQGLFVNVAKAAGCGAVPLGGPPNFSAGLLGGPPKAWIEEDRRSDWYCPNCRERNFQKRSECFKCHESKPEEGKGLPPPKPPPTVGQTLNGMVKSYNKKGFGYIMCLGENECQDIYYTRDDVSPRLLHPDMPGEHVTFELCRDGRWLVAKNIRPLGEDFSSDAKGHIFVKQPGAKGNGDEDRTQDWACLSCGERNFLKRLLCYKCRTPRDRTADTRPKARPAPRRTFSPHAGSRGIRESLIAAGGIRSRSKKKGSNSSSSSSRSKPKKKKKKNKTKKRKSSSSSSPGSKISSSASDCEIGAASAGSGAPKVQPSDNPEIDAAKAAALEQMMKLSKLENKEEKLSGWRALLRQWHPDKNPERIEMATAVFQFLQKGKPIVDS